MGEKQPKLPSFKSPPLHEVALSVQFEPLQSLGLVQLGLLWSEFRGRFPQIEEHGPIETIVERLGVRRKTSAVPEMRLLSAPPLPRIWFLNEEKRELVQVQNDHFVRNWRKIKDSDEYPRYDEYIRCVFEKDLHTFQSFLAKEQLGKLVPNQCEVTYVNHIVAGDGWETHANLGSVFNGWANQFSEDVALEIEDIRLAVRYIIYNDNDEFLGRLHMSIEPAFNVSDDKPIFIMKLTARGKPLGEDIPGILKFMDLGRMHIVNSFAAMTTPNMHKVWGRLS